MRGTRLINKPGIYQIQSKVNGKIYIGSAINIKLRIQQGHFLSLKKGVHDNSHLQRHSNKYGIKDLQFSILEFCSKEKLIEREQYYIDTLKPEFNICLIAGSQLGMRHSKETREKMKEAHKNRSEEVNKHHGKMMKGKRNPMYGKTHSKEAKYKLQIANLGKKISEETRLKMSNSHIGKGKGKIISQKTRRKMSKAAKERMSNKENNPMYGKKHSEETKQKIRNTQKERCKNLSK